MAAPKPYSQSSRKFARAARSHMTRGEEFLWQAIRRKQLGVHFRRNMPLGPYFPDFAAPSVRLIVEVDGRTHNTEEAKQRDKTRQHWLETQGWQVLRFGDEVIIGGSQAMIETTRAAVQARLAALRKD